MSLLSDLEKRIERTVEGIFSRKSRRVEPMDLARFLRKEMRDCRRSGLDKNYVPNLYQIQLSSDDHKHLVSLGASVMGELENYLRLEAQSQEWSFVGDVAVKIKANDALPQGEIDISAEIVEDVVYGDEGVSAGTASHSHKSAEDSGWLLYAKDGPSDPPYSIPQWGAMIGRSQWAEVRLDFPEVSRQHAQITVEGARLQIEDLESTNGTFLNERRVNSADLQVDDLIRVGNTVLKLQRKDP